MHHCIYKGMGAPTKIKMYNLFVGPQGLKWNLKVNCFPLLVMLPQFRLLSKIVFSINSLAN